MNRPPLNPIIEGQYSAYVDELCNFTITSSDPDEDKIKYIVDWGDYSVNSSNYIFNESYNISHKWSSSGYYTINVEVRDYNLSSFSDKTIIIRDKYIPNNSQYNYLLIFVFIIFIMIGNSTSINTNKIEGYSTRHYPRIDSNFNYGYYEYDNIWQKLQNPLYDPPYDSTAFGPYPNFQYPSPFYQHPADNNLEKTNFYE